MRLGDCQGVGVDLVLRMRFRGPGRGSLGARSQKVLKSLSGVPKVRQKTPEYGLEKSPKAIFRDFLF